MLGCDSTASIKGTEARVRESTLVVDAMKKIVSLGLLILFVSFVVPHTIASPVGEQFYGNRNLTGTQGNVPFILSVDPSVVSVYSGYPAIYNVKVTAVGNFRSSVSLMVTGLPPSSSSEFLPTSVTAPLTSEEEGATSSIQLTIYTSQTTMIGSYNLTITGASLLPAFTARINVTLIVTIDGSPWDLRLANQTLTVKQNHCGNVTVATHSEYGTLDSPFVQLNVTGLPPDVTADFEPNPINLAVGETRFSTLNVCAGFNSQPGHYALQVTGMSSTIFHSASLTLSVLSAITNAITTATTTATFSEDNVTTTITIKCSGYIPQPDYPASVNTSQNFTITARANFECTPPMSSFGVGTEIIDLSDGTVITGGSLGRIVGGAVQSTHFTISIGPIPVTAPATPKLWLIQLRMSLDDGLLVVLSDPITIQVQEAHPKSESTLLPVGLVGISAAILAVAAVILYLRIGRKRIEPSPKT